MSSSGFGQWIWYRSMASTPSRCQAGLGLAQDRVALEAVPDVPGAVVQQRALGEHVGPLGPGRPARGRRSARSGRNRRRRRCRSSSPRVPAARWIAAIDSSSSCGPQPNSQPPPPIAHAPKPTRVISRPVSPNAGGREAVSAAWLLRRFPWSLVQQNGTTSFDMLRCSVGHHCRLTGNRKPQMQLLPIYETTSFVIDRRGACHDRPGTVPTPPTSGRSCSSARSPR